VRFGACAYPRQCAAAADDRQDFVQWPAARADGLAQHFGLRRRGRAQRVNQRQGDLALGQIVADVLAQRVGIGGVIQQVIGDLEGEAQLQPVARQRRAQRRGGIGQHAAETARGGEQYRGLAFDHAVVGGFVGIRIAHAEQLQHLALGDGVGGIGEDAHHAHVIQFDHQLERARIEKIADQHAGRVAPQRVGGLASAAQAGFVDHVVVQQGRGVNELDDRGQLVVLIARIAGCLRGQHVQ